MKLIQIRLNYWKREYFALKSRLELLESKSNLPKKSPDMVMVVTAVTC